MQNASELLAARHYLKNYIPPDQQTILSIRGKVIGCLQSLAVFSGIPKSGKTTYMAGAIASAFMPGPVFDIKLTTPTDRKKIALFDTESSEFDFYKHLGNIKKFAGLDNLPDWFNAFACREDSPKTIIDLIEHYLSINSDCSVLIIDGLLDLLLDFNNVEESKNLINWIKKITKKYNILIIAVLHLGKKDQQTLGHLGSMADRLVQSSVKIERNKEAGTFDLSPTFLRSDSDFDPVRIRNINGEWFECDDGPQESKKRNYNDFTLLEHKNLILKTVSFSGSSYKDLIDTLREEQATGINAAKNIVKKWIAERWIEKKENLYFKN